jgi:DNA-binding NarL/FixJ family response regulator
MTRNPPATTPMRNALTSRQAQLLDLLCTVYCNQAAARAMRCSVKAVDDHMRRIRERLQMEHRLEIVLGWERENRANKP